MWEILFLKSAVFLLQIRDEPRERRPADAVQEALQGRDRAGQAGLRTNKSKLFYQDLGAGAGCFWLLGAGAP